MERLHKCAVERAREDMRFFWEFLVDLEHNAVQLGARNLSSLHHIEVPRSAEFIS